MINGGIINSEKQSEEKRRRRSITMDREIDTNDRKRER